MSERNEYNKISFKGTLLIPSFSIYLFEIDYNIKYYYLGMTGDPFYPSARSAIHRLSGHFEKNINSTQNQVFNGIKSIKDIDLSLANISMHHWNINGFKPWGKPLRNFNRNSLSENDKSRYNEYLNKQKKVHELELHLINMIRNKIGDRCLNKQTRIINEDFNIYEAISNEILSIVK